ncbi:MAG: alpha/beta hydrolase [Planctomycetaceae bacterium]|nr:alpha/beta hydrolase [Planctomycetaceae bacterium]
MLYFLLGIVLFVICFVGCQADFVARQLLFHPTKYPKGNWEILDDAKYVSMEVNFRNEKDQLLVGRYFSYQKIVENDTARGSVLYCHGNAINISHMTDFALRLSRDLRCNVLIFDYAGYGKSSGEPTATGILGDGRAARDWLAAFDGIDRERVIVYGQSLGGSVAVDIAAIDGARGLIVESSFTSIGDMGRKLLPLLPANYLLRERLASIDKIGNVNCPVFISHGKADNVIPFTQGQRLFNAAKEPKTFFIPQLGNDYHSAPHSKEHRKKLKEFVETIP